MILFEILLAIAVGITAGIFTGLTPGIHVNLITVIAISIIPKISLDPFYVITALLSMGITHTFVDSIPSILLGAPDESHIISALPGHKMFLEGNALQAIYLTIIGGFTSLVLSLLSVPFIILIITLISDFVSALVGWIILILIVFLILESQNIYSFILFLFSGILGLIVFDMWWLKEPLLPLLSGLFGVSLLVMSLQTKKQSVKQNKLVTYSPSFSQSSLAVTGGFFASFLPGLGSSQMAVLLMRFLDKSKESLLLFTGGINTVSMMLSLCTFYVVQKARNGLIVGVSDIFSLWSLDVFFYFICVVFFAGCVSAILVIPLAKSCLYILEKLPYAVVVITVIASISILVFHFDSWFGLGVLAVSTLLGIWCEKQSVAKHFLLGCLLVPVIGFFLL